jgi:hypothetical protein
MSLRFLRHEPVFAGIASPVVQKVYFDSTTGNSIRFYQNAHNTYETVPQYFMPTGQPFPIYSCWTDIYTAILEAQKFVFLTGWSVHPLTQLVRHGTGRYPPIGELLKDASERGVMVRTAILLVSFQDQVYVPYRCKTSSRVVSLGWKRSPNILKAF